jgi:hypothetical protein
MVRDSRPGFVVLRAPPLPPDAYHQNRGPYVSNQLTRLLEAAKKHEMSATEQEAQRRSFAYGNANLEDERVTRETVKKAAEDLSKETGGGKR